MTPKLVRLACAVLLSLGSAFALQAQAPVLERDAQRTVADTIGGDGAPYSIRSAILSETRRVNIATPPSFSQSAPSRRYPVFITFDGEYNFAQTIVAAKYLAEAGQVPEALVVAIENISNDPRDRVRDLTPPGLSVSGTSQNQGGDRFLDFIERELLPALAQQFRASAPCVLIGHSSGGVIVTYAAAARPKSFPFLVSIDAPVHLQDNWLVKRLTESAAERNAHYLRYVSLESRFGWSDKTWSALQSAAPPNWKLHREKFTHESHNSMGFLGTYIGLRELFADYSMLAAPDSPTSASLEHYRKFNEATGLALVPPRPLLSRTIEDLLMEGRADLAQKAFDTLTAGYGETPRAAQTRAQIAEAAKLPPLAETVEDLLKAPRPTAEQIAPFLGEWNGFSQFGDAPRHPMRLRIEIKDGVVGGATINWPAPDVEMVIPLQYLKVVEGGLHFGHMNGMRPRGMIVFEGVLRDGKLEGEAPFRGIRFTPPGGREAVHRFTLEHTAKQ